MKLLAIECSAKAASAALWEDDRIAGEFYLNIPQTHSETLMPMAEELLRHTGWKVRDLDALAVSQGPGSFTGLRIGISAVKGMALGAGKPCIGISTLEGLANNLRGFEGYAAAVMDARCQQVYTALFRLHDGRAERLTDDEALMLSDLQQRLSGLEGPVYLVGDGAQISWNYLSGKVGQLRMAPAALRFQRASSVAVCAAERMAAGEAVSGDELVPSYLRLPQAERELKKSR